MKHLTAKDWEDFERLHRSAFYFLLHRSLVRERIALLSTTPEHKSDWEKARLIELNELNENTGKSLDNL